MLERTGQIYSNSERFSIFLVSVHSEEPLDFKSISFNDILDEFQVLDTDYAEALDDDVDVGDLAAAQMQEELILTRQTLRKIFLKDFLSVI